jgi:hypothetical protein
MLRFTLLFGLFLILAQQVGATPCLLGGTLASYEALGATGCTIGPQTVQNFSFSSLSGGETDTAITVTPTSGVNSNGSFYGLIFSGFATGSGSANYLIGYTWDSIPIRGMGDIFDDPGTVDILNSGCVGAAFIGSSCSGTPVSVDVNTGSLTGFIAFSPTATLGISNNISLSPASSFTSLENDAYVVPEPASFLLTGLGLTILVAGVRRRGGTLGVAGQRSTAAKH